MTSPRLIESEFIELFDKLGPAALSKKFQMSIREVYRRRASLEKKLGIEIKGPVSRPQVRPTFFPWRKEIEIRDGIVLVAGDAHYWPGPPTLMHRAFVRFCKEYKPRAVVIDGDVIDAPTISRHSPIGWEKRPQLSDEIEAAKERMSEIEAATFKAQKIWTLGNHDSRFETRIAMVAPEYAKIHGVHLRDHFPNWEPAWSCWINDSVVVKHKFKGGIHATHNNTLHAGKTMITGHLHSAKVTPYDDYNGTRYGVDAGCIADTDARAFADYTEDDPKNWRSGFCVLTFKDGKLMMPELVTKWNDESVQFRGEIISP